MNEETLFLRAMELPANERSAILDRECPDPVLRARIEALLAADAAAHSPLDSPPHRTDDATLTHGDPAATGSFRPAASPEEAEGVVIAGRYKLRQQIGEGGMGTVWMADQTEPVKRKVAVKLIRVERGQSKTILARFEAERQAIALMDHPHIAKLLDAGTTDTGAPFFVMELVKGIPLSDYCDTHKLTISVRLNLFTQICSAVQHAHQKGIIHRDLKPSNILVESHDGKPVPKVIDFGLAKATTGLQLSEHSMFTAFGSVMGTPLYMAPEQASFNAIDVDTRADVYALGVILYELLTGTTPLTKETMKNAALDEMLRLIREQEAPTPSSRLSSADSTPSVAASRQIEPLKLGRFVKGELDWIVLKALAKDRDRRYETANGFARDIERFLNHEPVQAGPPSASYRLRKFVRRNRPQVIAACLVLLALVAGVVGTSLGLLEARRQTEYAREQEAEAVKQTGIAQANEGLANTRLQEVEAEKRKVEAETKRADEEKQIAQAVTDFLQNKLFAQADATTQTNRSPQGGGLAARVAFNPKIRDLLYVAAEELALDKIEANFPKQPLLQAELLRTLGNAYVGIGEPGSAIDFMNRSVVLFRQHHGPEHAVTLASMNNQAEAYRSAGKVELALPVYVETLKLRKAKLGPDHPDTLASMNNLANGYRDASKLDLALPLFEETLKLRKAKLGPDHPDTLASMNNLAQCHRDAGSLDKAMPLFEETLQLREAKFGPDHPDTLASMNNLAEGHRDNGHLEIAMTMFENAFKRKSGKLGPDHPTSIALTDNIFLTIVQSEGDLGLTLFLYAERLKQQMTQLGPDHPFTLKTMNMLGYGHRMFGRLDLALPMLEEAFKRRKAKLGPDHPDTLTSMNDLAETYRAAGKLDLASPLHEETLKLRKARLVSDHPDTLTSMNNLAECYRTAGKPNLALPLYEETLKRRQAKLGPDHPDTFISMYNLGLGHRAAGQMDKAVPLLEETLTRVRAKLKPDHPAARLIMSDRAATYQAEGKLDKALQLWTELSVANPKDTRVSLKVAALQVWFGHDQDYAATVVRTLQSTKDTREPSTAERTAKLSSLRHDDDMERLAASLALATKAVELGKTSPYLGYFQMALGLAQYRSGLFAEADATFAPLAEKEKNNKHIAHTVDFYRAMTLFRLGKLDEAKALATATTEAMRPLPADDRNPLADNANADDIIVWLAYKEAKALVKFEAEARKQEPKAKEPKK